MFELGESLTPRYKILSKLGEGTFGRVLECADRETKRRVAIKIIRNVPKYRDAAMMEIEALGALARKDPKGAMRCVQLLRWFEYRGHVCMVFECLGLSLFDFLHKNRYRPFPLQTVRAFGRQLLEAVAFMHSLELTHTDLKPENVLLTNPSYSKVACPYGSKSSYRIPKSNTIKLIDFGSATFERQHHSRVVSTRHYRAPEVILGLGWSYPCDAWSIGCILVELLTGDALFQTHDNLEHLAMMQQVLGRMDQSMAARCDRAIGTEYFRDFAAGGTPVSGGGRVFKLDWPARDGRSSLEGERAVRRMRGLADMVSSVLGSAPVSASNDLQDSCVDLLRGLLRYDPSQRLTAQQALAHPFLRDEASPSNAGVQKSAPAIKQPSEQQQPHQPPKLPPHQPFDASKPTPTQQQQQQQQQPQPQQQQQQQQQQRILPKHKPPQPGDCGKQLIATAQIQRQVTRGQVTVARAHASAPALEGAQDGASHAAKRQRVDMGATGAAARSSVPAKAAGDRAANCDASVAKAADDAAQKKRSRSLAA